MNKTKNLNFKDREVPNNIEQNSSYFQMNSEQIVL